MKKYIEQLEDNCRNHGEYIAIKSSARAKGITYAQLWEFSGKLYSYLKTNNIGKEDMILICLPRGIRSMVATIGVIKAGAAFTIVESTYGKDRIEYIKKDCNCRLVIDDEVYAEAMTYSFLEGYVETDPHDACFAVYTSGSTGNPKGVLHEYGKIEKCILSQKTNYEGMPENGTGGNPAPLNFVASLMMLFGGTYYADCIYVMPYDVVKDIEKLTKFIEDNNVYTTFMTYSLFKAFKKLPSCLKRISLGSEPCNGAYMDGIMLTNSYAASETAFTIALFKIDKPYEITPVGKNLVDIKVQIVDENGNELPQGEVGEIYVEDEYTRGYINLPEKTKEAFVDGIYHTGDLGLMDENGNLVIKGRKDDMIKINGNRIEPAEIENSVKKVLGVKNVIAKGFTSDKRSYICAYLIKNELQSLSLLNDKGNLNISAEEVGKKLSTMIPYYMIPTYYMVLDSYPLNPNGKIARIKLQAPEIDLYREEYVAPSTQTEKYLCDLFSKVLKVDNVSINDDFYSLGGDSLASVYFVSECELKGLTTTDIYRYRTVKKIAEYYDEFIANNNMDINQKNIKALEHEQLLLPEMQTVIDCQDLAPESIMWNLPFLFKLKEDIDLTRLACAIDKVLMHHPIYSTEIEYDGYLVPLQKYNPDIYEKTKIVEISDKEFDSLKDQLIKPFFAHKQPYLRKVIYKTETNSYLFIDHYHIITDGTSLDIVFKQITNCYNNQDYNLPADYYYLMLREEEKKKARGEFDEITDYYKTFAKKYFIDHNTDYCIIPDNMPESTILSKSKMFEADLLAKPEIVNANRGTLSENEFFIISVLLAMAKYNSKDSSYLQWVFNGRDSKEKMDMAGLLYRSLPVAGICDTNKTLKDYYDEIAEQVRFTSTHNSIKISTINYEFDYSLFFLFQKNIINSKDFPLAKERIELKEDNTADSLIEMMLFADKEDKYYCTIEYDTSIYNHESIVKFFNYFNEISNKLSTIINPNDIKLSSIFD